jgi:hypothetical protein
MVTLSANDGYERADDLQGRSQFRDGPGFAVAIADPSSGPVRVPLIGWLDALTAALLTEGLVALHGRKVFPGAGVRCEVLLDLSALHFVDRVGLGVFRTGPD